MRFKSIHTRPSSRLIPRLERLDDRALPSVSVVETSGTLLIRGDRHANTVLIADNGTADDGNVVVQIDGQSYTSQGAITTIRVFGGSVADSVEYDLNGDLASARTVEAHLGNGNDSFVARVQANLNDQANLTIRAWGGNGDDQLSLDAIGANVQAGGLLSVNFDGGNGKDNLQMNFSGVIMGTTSFAANGGNGKDVVAGQLNVEPIVINPETHQTSPSTGSLTAIFRGGNGVDAMTLNVTGTDSLTTLDAKLNGGNGKDTFDATSNVTIVDPPGKKK
jgi:hypothetical protein